MLQAKTRRLNIKKHASRKGGVHTVLSYIIISEILPLTLLERENTKKAIMHYKVLLRLKSYSLLKVTLETGRHHQIRVQLSQIQHSIKGDLKYNSKRSNRDQSISLLAKTLKFTHPVSGKEIEIDTELPHTDIWKIIRKELATQL